MEVIKLHKNSDANGVIHLDVPTHYNNCETNVVVIVEPVLKEDKKQNYDFSDLSGKLDWQGDAVEEQRGLRDEW